MAQPKQPKQLDDPVKLALRLSPTTEEWADALLGAEGWLVERTDEALIVRHTYTGNCNAISNAATFLRDVEDVLQEGNIDPMCFILVAS